MLCFIVSGPRPPCELSIPGKGTSNPCFFINASTTVYVECIQQYVFSTSSGMSLCINEILSKTKKKQNWVKVQRGRKTAHKMAKLLILLMNGMVKSTQRSGKLCSTQGEWKLSSKWNVNEYFPRWAWNLAKTLIFGKAHHIS